MQAKQILNNQFDQMVQTLQQVVRLNTEKGAPAENAPFGKNIADCLQFVLDTAKQMGFETYNCDNFAGHVDFVGTGTDVLGILGHLDVVPAKAEEWAFPPYAGEISNGKLYARGTMDDKGPMIACLFALKALKQSGFIPNKTIRLIFGCDEESGMQCVQHYFQKMPFPTVAFSPDGDFPVINREKGIYQFTMTLGKLPEGVEICAGERANVVPSKCTCIVPNGDLLQNLPQGVSVEQVNGKALLTTLGKSAHGSTPDEGINATHLMLQTLCKLYPTNQTLDFVANKMCDTTGGAWGIALCDQPSGKLTCNLGVLRTQSDGTLQATVDIRFPVTYTCQQMYNVLKQNTPSIFHLGEGHTSEPLYVPSDSALVTTLMNVYNTAMESSLEPIAIGGGTYSRCLPNCVAFGPLFPGEEQTIHMPNECIDLQNLRKMAEIFLEAIYQLAK